MVNKGILSILMCGLLSQTTLASVSGEKCKTIHYQEDRVYSIKSKLHEATHIILPENILGEPINGDTDLWNVEGQLKHLFIQPNSTLDEGKVTTVTVVSVSDRSFNFKVDRVKKNPDRCVVVKLDGKLLGNKHAMSNYVSPQKRQMDSYQLQINELQRRLSDSQQVARKKAENALQKYRSYIYTRYTWDQGDGFMGADAITDVYDDGRFTYIRMKNDNKGLLSVSADIDGSEEFIEFKFDDKTNIYKVSGIYPKFNLNYGEKQKIAVTRSNNLTQGQY